MKMDIHVKAIEEGKEFKGGINKMPTRPRPNKPPKGQWGKKKKDSGRSVVN